MAGSTIRFADFIAGQPQNNTPEYTPGIVNNTGSNSTVKSQGNGGLSLIGKLIGANMNTTSDQIINLINGNSFIIVDVVYTNASKSLSMLHGQNQAYTGPGLTGRQIWFDGGSTGGLTISANYYSILSQYISLSGGLSIINQNKIYFNLTNALGSAATIDIYIYGYILA